MKKLEKTKRLTDEQRQFAEENHGLLLAFLKRKHLPIFEPDMYSGEDWYGVAAIGYCKAVLAYDKNLKTPFSSFAFACMEHECSHAHKRMFTKSRHSDDGPEISLNNMIENENGEICELVDAIVDRKSEYENAVVLSDVESNVIKRYSPKSQDIFKKYLAGWSQGEIADFYSCTRQYVSFEIIKIRKGIKDELG